MSSVTSLRLERIPASRWPPAPGRGTAPDGHWVISSGGVPVLRCDDEATARRLLEAVEERLALRAAS
jgi:hypothetical protein